MKIHHTTQTPVFSLDSYDKKADISDCLIFRNDILAQINSLLKKAIERIETIIFILKKTTCLYCVSLITTPIDILFLKPYANETELTSIQKLAKKKHIKYFNIE